jgi:hypothetical protein
MNDGTQTAESTLKPFHESVVDAINRATIRNELGVLAMLISETKIPKGHDAIVEAWTAKCQELGYNDPLDVSDGVLAQKHVEEAKAAEKAAEKVNA